MGKLFFFLLFFMILFLPIYFECVAYYDSQKRKLVFSTRLYKWIPLVGGYLATYKGGLAMHIGEKKAVLIPYKEWKEEQKRISIFRLFRLETLRICIETEHESLRPALFFHHFLRIYLFAKYEKRRNMKNILYINEENDGIKASFRSVLSLNLYKIIKYAIQIAKEKIRNLWNKKMKKLIN